MEQEQRSPSPHWLKPLKGGWRKQRHLLIWPVEETVKKRIVCRGCVAELIRIDAAGALEKTEESYSGQDGLERVLDAASQGKGKLTIWIPSGWEHLVLSGLAEQIDRGKLTWTYCLLDTHRVLLRGLWCGRPVTITSLANWTGGTWDSVAGSVPQQGRELFHRIWMSAQALSRTFRLGILAPSAGAAGQLLWRSMLGPRVRVLAEPPRKGEPPSLQGAKQFVAPIPRRPLRARQAERHVTYGLAHRQLRAGLVDGPIYCVDVTSCYLLCLMTTPLPVMYARTLHRPSVRQLAEELLQHTGCALVQLRSPELAYPLRRQGKNLWARGEFYTWLAGSELARALYLHHVQSCEAAHLWSAARQPAELASNILQFGDALKEEDEPVGAKLWRSMYSHLVGRFAGWRRDWKDWQAMHAFGKWASWLGADPDTGRVVQYRSVAGRVQRQLPRQESSSAVPLLFGCVTAAGRVLMQSLAEIAGWGNVLAVEADSLWVAAPGWQRLQKRVSELDMPPDNIRCKEVFSAAWMSGASIALVEMDGRKYMRCPGVPAEIAVGPHGQVSWPEAQGWAEDGRADQRAGVLRRERRYSVKRIMREFSHAPRELPVADDFFDPMLPEELLLPVVPINQEVDHAE